MTMRLFFILSVSLACLVNACYSKDNPIEVKISAPKIYDAIEIKVIYPKNYIETKIYPVIFTDTHQPFRFKNLDPNFWNKFAEEGFVVIQLSKYLFSKHGPNHIAKIDKLFFKKLQKDIPIDLNNIFSVGVNNSDFLYWCYIFQNNTAFKGVVCVEYLYEYHNFYSRKKKNEKEWFIPMLPILVIADKNNNLDYLNKEAEKYKTENFKIDLKIIDELPKIENVSMIINWCNANK